MAALFPFFLRLWVWRRPAALREFAAQRGYYEILLKGLLPGSYRAFDIGANEGFVSDILLQKGLSVAALDPDQRNARHGRNERFLFYPVAAGGRAGTLPLFLKEGASALSTLEPKWKGAVEGVGHRLHSCIDIICRMSNYSEYYGGL